jgi:hypothetical protein
MQERHFTCKLVARPWPLRWFSAPSCSETSAFLRVLREKRKQWLRDGRAAVEDLGDLGHWLQDGRRRGGIGFWAALAARYGGLGGFRGGVACETTEPDYIGCCNITKIASSFPLRDGVLSRRAGQIGKFVCQIVECGRLLLAKISGCAPTLFRMPAETFKVLFFLKWSLYFFL